MATCPTCRTHYPDGTAACANDGDTLLPDEAFAGADRELQAGEIVGEYRIEGKLGEGGFGTVYRAVHPLIGKTCAIKMLHRQYSSNPQMVSRFIAEARAVNQIRHRNIIDIFSFGALPDGRQYYLMELLDGAPFDRYLKEKGRLTPEQALPILRPIARALDAAHAHGIAHRDLKPENVFIVFDDDGAAHPKLLDFGIAKLLTNDASGSGGGAAVGGHKTRTGAPMGTPNYMSPEQCRGQNVDQRTDIYAFGILCHEVLTGKLPFDGETVMDVLMKHMSVPAPRVSEVCPDLRPELDAAILHMLAKDPAARPKSVGAALDELYVAAAQAGYGIPNVAMLSVPSGDGRTSGPNVHSTPGRGGTPGWTPSGATPGGATPRGGAAIAPPQDIAALAHARTVAHVDGGATPTAGKTLNPAESDIGRGFPSPKKRLIGAVIVLALVMGASSIAFHKGKAAREKDGPAGSTSATIPESTSALSRDGIDAAASAFAASSPLPTPLEVEVLIFPAPPKTTVYLGPKKLGDAPGPFHLPAGPASVTLTLKAPGYKSANIDVTPTENVTLPANLAKAGPAASGSHPAGRDALENF